MRLIYINIRLKSHGTIGTLITLTYARELYNILLGLNTRPSHNKTEALQSESNGPVFFINDNHLCTPENC